MRKALVALLLVLLAVLPAQAQLSLPYTTFTSGQVISSSQFTTNFTQISSNALNRTGGTMTGNLLFSADNTLDIGASGATRPRDLFLGRNAVVGGTLNVTGTTTFAALSATTGSFSSNVTVGGTLGVTGATTLSSTLAVTGNTTVGGTLGVTGASTFAAVSATTGSFSSNATVGGTLGVTGATTLSAALGGTSATFSGTVTAATFSGSGASLTSIPETAITDGTLLARVGANETITGTWNVTSGQMSFTASSFTQILLNQTGAAANNRVWLMRASSATFDVAVCDDALAGCPSALSITRSGSTPSAATFSTSLTVTGATTTAGLTNSGALANSGSQDVTLSTGNNNNVTVNSGTYLLRITTAVGATNHVTGLTGGASGRALRVCHVSGTGDLDFLKEDANSTAANRFALATSAFSLTNVDDCSELLYDGTTSRWRPIRQ